LDNTGTVRFKDDRALYPLRCQPKTFQACLGFSFNCILTPEEHAPGGENDTAFAVAGYDANTCLPRMGNEGPITFHPAWWGRLPPCSSRRLIGHRCTLLPIVGR
jgi:hypothetical protein